MPAKPDQTHANRGVGYCVFNDLAMVEFYPLLR